MSDGVESVAVIILAAGKGTRMKSEKAKFLHEINGSPMVKYLVDSAKQIAGNHVIIVIGHQAEIVREVVSATHADVSFAVQHEQLGTGHAVQCAMPHVPAQIADIVILCGDVPLISPVTIRRLLAEHHRAKRDLTVLAVKLKNPKGYGRMLIDHRNRVTGIVEEADATGEQKKIRTVNSGIYCATKPFLDNSLGKINSNNAQGEFYLTDIMEIGHRDGKNVGALVWSDSEEVLGVNTLRELELAETIMKRRLIKRS